MKTKLQTLFLIIISIWILGSSYVYASSPSLSENEFSVYDVITIIGTDFGSSPGIYGALCFDSENSCYLSGNLGIQSWKNTVIKFIVPSFAPTGGDILVYNDVGNKVATLAYIIEPVIDFVANSDSNVIDAAIPGETLYITGYGFGAGSANVSIGSSSYSKGLEVLIWTETEIVARIPEEFYIRDDYELVVRNEGGGKGTVPFAIYEKLTDDPLSNYQTYLDVTRINDAWGELDTKNKVVVAVIDDGIYQNHEDFEGRLWDNEDEIIGNNKDDDSNGYVDDAFGYNFLNDTEEITQLGAHGTTVAGIIGAIKDNNIGVAGISDNVILMPLIVCDADGCNDSAIIEAIYYAVDNGARVINVSLGSIWTNGYSDDYNEVIEYAYSNNVVIVVAAGNGDPYGGEGYDLDRIPNSPVCNDNNEDMVLGVGASTKDGVYRTSWSNYGSCVDIYAPGEQIASTSAPTYESDNFYQFGNGTSFSAPIVAGVAAEMISAYPQISNRAVYDYIISNTKNDGVLDAVKVFKALKDEYDSDDEWVQIGTTPIDDSPLEEKEVKLFSDLLSGHKNYEAIVYLKNEEVIGGYPDGSFKPENPVNRAELLKILVEGQGVTPSVDEYSDCFPDVKDDWYAPYVCYALEEGWVNGYPDGSFKPEQTVNKVEAIKMLLNSQEVEIPEEVEELPFEDMSLDDWFVYYVDKAKALGILEETGDEFSGGDGMKRAGICENLYRLLTN